MKKEVIIVLLNQFADWETGFLMPAINVGVGFEPKETPYITKTLSLDGKEVRSIGGMRVVPDYSLETLPEDFSALILIGGFEWFDEEAKSLVPLVQKAKQAGKLVAGICNASIFLAVNGFLNDVKHTSNMLEFILQQNDSSYHGQNNYLCEQAVMDKNIITANGAASLDFAKKVFQALEIDTPENIEKLYDLHKLGLYAFMKKWGAPG